MIRLRTYFFPTLWCFFMGLLYAERLVYDKMLWVTYGKFWESLRGADVFAAFGLIVFFYLLALLISKEFAVRWWRKTFNKIRKYLIHTKEFIIYFLIGIVLIRFVIAVIRGESIIDVLKSGLYIIFDLLKHIILPILPSLLFLLTILIASSLAHTLHKKFMNKEGQILETTFKEWVIGNYFIGIAFLFYVIIWYFSVWYRIEAPHRFGMWMDHFKDSFIYTIFGAFYVNLLERFGKCGKMISQKAKWISIATVFVLGILVATILAKLDFDFARELQGNPSFHPELSNWQRDIIVNHIYLRDISIMIFSAAVFCRNFWRFL